MTQKQVEVAFCAAFLALLVAGWISLSEVPPQAQLFPHMIIGLTGAVTAAMAVRALHAMATGRDDPSWRMFKDFGRWLIAVVALPLYVFGVSTIGYFTSTMIFIPALAIVLGYRRPIVAITIALVFDAAIYGIFITLFGRRLPADILLGL